MSVGAEEKPSFVERGFGYFRGLASAFGWRYCAIVALVYGVNQGMGETFLFQAQKYYFFDTIKVNASRYSQIDGFTNIPWQIKAIYGMISDSYSIGGRRRTPYMIVAGFCGVGASLGLWLIPPQQLVATVLSVLANFSIASPDVMIDASAAERAKTHPHLTADLQSLCWGSLHVCSFFSHVVVGYLLAPNILGPRGVFALFSLTSLANLLPAMANWLGEKRTSEHTGEGQRHEVMNPLSSTDDDLRVAVEDPPILYFEDLAKKRARQLPAFLAALCTCGVSVAIGAIQVFYQGPDPTLVAASTTVALGCFLCVSLYVLLKKVDRDLAGVAVFVFLVGCFQPLTDVIFDWSHDDGEKYGRCSKKCEDRDDDGECGWAIDRDYPCISKSYYGHMLALAELFGVVGIVIYNVYMSEWSFRSTFGFVQLLYFAANLIDILWVARINLALGIPDELMLCGLEIIQPICRLIHLMPLMVLAAKVCPKDLEATLFALLMGLSNFGSVVGLYNGGALLHVYGVDQPDFNNLSVFVFTRTLLFLVPILFLGLLPKGGPKDRLDHEAEDEDDDDDGGSYKVPTNSRAPSEIELMQPGGASVEDANGGDDSGVHMITEEEKRAMVFFRRPLFLAGSAVALFDVSLPPVGWVEEITDTDEKVRLSSSSKFQSVVDVLEMFEDWSEPYVAAFDEGDRVAAPTAGNVSERLGALLDRGQSAVFRVEKLDSEGQETLYEGLHGLRGQRYYSTHLYFSSPGSAALKNHSDVTDVAVWQLAGSKSWLLCDADRVETASIARRLDTCATYDDDDMATIDAETSGDCRTVLLEAGDALWVPRRTVHSARATDESLASLHVTVAIENVRRRRRAQMTTPVTFVDGCEDAGLVENCFCEVQGGGETGGDTQCSRDEVGPERCPPGTFSPTGFYAAETESSCNDGCDADCDAGCDNVGSSCDRSCDDSCDTNCDECATCRACPAGRFSSEFGSTTCTECPGGDLEACSNECVTASPTIVDNDQPNAPPSLGPGQSSKKKKSSGDDTGAAGLIIGIVVLVLILLLCAAALGYYFHKRAHGVQYASATEIENDPIPGFNIVELPSFGSKK